MTTGARFVTMEGIEGVGKSTQIARLSTTLAQRAIAHAVTREPGGTPLAEKIRALVLAAADEPMPPCAELLLMFAARAVHLANCIEPALNAGRWVLCDRFTDATYAYQGAGRGLSEEAIAQLEQLVQGGRRPDLTILLDAPVELAMTRMRRRGEAPAQDRFEAERADFFERVRLGYLKRAALAPDRIIVIDASRSESQVAADVNGVLEARRWIR
jgi:dTMP kinase